MTLNEKFLDLSELYGWRNAMYLRGDTRSLFAHDAVLQLGKIIARKGERDPAILAGVLASVFGRMAAFADSFRELPIVEAMSEKYPIHGCAYCGHMPCRCELNRKKGITLGAPSQEQLGWTVNDWCLHLDEVYGESNHKRGQSLALHRLGEELHEVEGALLFGVYNRKLDLRTLRQMIAREFADVFAWTFVLSTLLEVDLDTALNVRYNRSCKTCHQRPCICPPPFFTHMAGHESFAASPIAESRVAPE